MKALILFALLIAVPAFAGDYDAPTEKCMIEVIHLTGKNVRNCKAISVPGACEVCVETAVIPACQEDIDWCRATHADAVEVCGVNAETLCS